MSLRSLGLRPAVFMPPPPQPGLLGPQSEDTLGLEPFELAAPPKLGAYLTVTVRRVRRQKKKNCHGGA